MWARPSDRTKMPEEIAQEEKERLEHLEEKRQKRMAVADNPSDEDADTSEDDEESAKRPKHISGDDLGDSFSHDVKSKPKVGWIDEILRKGNASDLGSEDGTSSGESDNDDDDDEGSDNNHDKDEQSQSLKDWEQSDDENIGTHFEDEKESEDDDHEEEDEETLVDIVNQKKSSKSRGEQNMGSSIREAGTNLKEDLHQQVELPYTIEAPKNFEELCALLENRSDEQIVEAIRRIRTFNAITVAAENWKKMQPYVLVSGCFVLALNSVRMSRIRGKVVGLL